MECLGYLTPKRRDLRTSIFGGLRTTIKTIKGVPEDSRIFSLSLSLTLSVTFLCPKIGIPCRSSNLLLDQTGSNRHVFEVVLSNLFALSVQHQLQLLTAVSPRLYSTVPLGRHKRDEDSESGAVLKCSLGPVPALHLRSSGPTYGESNQNPTY